MQPVDRFVPCATTGGWPTQPHRQKSSKLHAISDTSTTTIHHTTTTMAPSQSCGVCADQPPKYKCPSCELR